MKKYALITGASGGIGREIARQLAQKGYNCLLVARSKDILEKEVRSIQEHFKVEADFLALDLSEINSSKKVLEWCESKNIKISILVNNAGYGLSGEFGAFSVEEYQNMITLNIQSLMTLSQLFFKQLQENAPEAYILNVASTAGYQAVPGLAVYAGTKAFVLQFSRGIYHEYKKSGIGVTALSPGATATNFVNRAQMDDKIKKTADKVNMTPEEVAKIGLDALFAKKPEVIAGFINKISVAGVWLLPKIIIEKIAQNLYLQKK